MRLGRRSRVRSPASEGVEDLSRRGSRRSTVGEVLGIDRGLRGRGRRRTPPHRLHRVAERWCAAASPPPPGGRPRQNRGASRRRRPPPTAGILSPGTSPNRACGLPAEPAASGAEHSAKDRAHSGRASSSASLGDGSPRRSRSDLLLALGPGHAERVTPGPRARPRRNQGASRSAGMPPAGGPRARAVGSVVSEVGRKAEVDEGVLVPQPRRGRAPGHHQGASAPQEHGPPGHRPCGGDHGHGSQGTEARPPARGPHRGCGRAAGHQGPLRPRPASAAR